MINNPEGVNTSDGENEPPSSTSAGDAAAEDIFQELEIQPLHINENQYSEYLRIYTSEEEVGPTTSHSNVTRSAYSLSAAQHIVEGPQIQPNQSNICQNMEYGNIYTTEHEEGPATSHSSNTRSAYIHNIITSEEWDGPQILHSSDSRSVDSLSVAKYIAEIPQIKPNQSNIRQNVGYGNIYTLEHEEGPATSHSSDTRFAYTHSSTLYSLGQTQNQPEKFDMYQYSENVNTITSEECEGPPISHSSDTRPVNSLSTAQHIVEGQKIQPHQSNICQNADHRNIYTTEDQEGPATSHSSDTRSSFSHPPTLNSFGQTTNQPRNIDVYTNLEHVNANTVEEVERPTTSHSSVNWEDWEGPQISHSSHTRPVYSLPTSQYNFQLPQNHPQQFMFENPEHMNMTTPNEEERPLASYSIDTRSADYSAKQYSFLPQQQQIQQFNTFQTLETLNPSRHEERISTSQSSNMISAYSSAAKPSNGKYNVNIFKNIGTHYSINRI